MYKDIFTQIGLTANEAIIYEFLLKTGETTAGEIIKKTPLNRGVIYNTLTDLVKKDLVSEKKKEGISHFSPNHPEKLNDFVETKEEQLKKAKNTLEANLSSIINSFSVSSNQPGAKYYEGKEGVIKALDQISKLLITGSEIISFVKVLPAEYEKELNSAFRMFIKKRLEKKVSTRVIALDTSEGKSLKAGDSMSLRETRLAPSENMQLDLPGGEIFIYGDLICLIATQNNKNFAFIVQNKTITQLLKAFFEVEWSLLGSF